MRLASAWWYLAALGCALVVQWSGDCVDLPLAFVVALPVGWMLRRV